MSGTGQTPTTPGPSQGGTQQQVPPTPIFVPPPPPRKPNDPLMGTCEETFKGSGSFYYVFGGKPKADWTGIQDLDQRSMSDLCFRSLDPVTGQKGVHHRTKPLSPKFGMKNSLAEFQADVWDHLVKFGLDTVSYLPDPRNINRVLCVVTKHAQFTGDMSLVEGLSNRLALKFDIWDKRHDNEAKSFLLSSLSEDLKKNFKPFHNKEKDTFAVTWLKLIHYLVSSNSRTFDKLKDDIRRIKPQLYPGQNIEKMSADYIEKAEELVNAGYFDHSLVLNMVDGFLCASRDSKGTFHHTMNDLRRNVDKLQQATIFMSREDQMNMYARERLTYKDVCFAAVKEYKTLCDDNLWEPKKLPKDRQAPPSDSANLAMISKALTLIASMPGQSENHSKNNNNNSSSKDGKTNRSGGRCFNCGKKGHTLKDCTEPKKTPEERKELRHKSMPAWQTKAPSQNQSQTKTVDGKTYHWCDKCGNWTSTHTAQQHGKGFKKGKGGAKSNKKKNNFAPETHLSAFEPQAWIVEVDEMNQPISLFNILKYIYFALTLAILMGLPVPTIMSLSEAYNRTDSATTVVFDSVASGFATLLQMHQLLKSTYAPLFWVGIGYVASKLPAWFTPTFKPELLHEVPRALRRTRSRSLSRPKYKLKSARDHRLTPRYPLKLRRRNQFNTRASTPTVEQRGMQTRLDAWIQRCAPNANTSPQSSLTPPHSPSHQPEHRYETPSRRHGRTRHRHHMTFQPDKSKGGYGTQRKHTCGNQPQGHAGTRPFTLSKHYCHKCARSHKGSTCSSSSSSHKRSSCPPVMTSVHQQSYVPTGLLTRRDSPNLNLTTSQDNKLRQMARTVLLTGAEVDSKTRALAQSISLLAPNRFRAALTATKESAQFPVIWDSGASICITPDKNDFVTYNTSTDVRIVKGVGGNATSVVGQGIVEWSIHDVNGALRKLKLPAYHIPNCKSRLISTSSLLNTYKGEHITIDGNSLKLSGITGDPTRSQVIVFNNPVTHLPTTTAYTSSDTDIPRHELNNVVTTVSESNHNLSEAQKELLRWHQRLGHLDFNKIKHLLRTGVLSHTEGSRSLHTAASKVEHNPKCAACLFGKQTIRSAPGKTVKVIKDRAGVLRAGNLLPGQEVSVDHFISSVRGRLFKGYNKGRIEDRYIGGCIFVDHSSSYIHIEFQSSLSSHETLSAKMEFEKHCRDVGVVPQKYMSDNGRSFASREFTEHLSNFYQISKFAGVGAHHHNAQAERAIRTIMSIARTMMIHAGIHWPDIADSTLWPMAVKHACFLFNHVPSHITGLSPSDLFTRTRWPQKKLLDLHVWGCPVYVLEKSLQDGKKIPKWKPRSNRSMYMGVSHLHASTVPLVLNLSTGAITPQFHVVFDDWFATIGSDHGKLPDFSSNEWNKMFGDSEYQYLTDDVEENENTDDLIDTLTSQMKADKIANAQDKVNPPQPLEVDQPVTQTKPELANTPARNTQPVPDKNVPMTKAEEVPAIKEQVVEETESQEPPREDSPERKPLSPVKRTKSKRKPALELGPRRSRRSGNKVIERLTYSHDARSLTHSANLVMVDISDENIHVYYVTPDCSIMVASSKQNNPDIFSYDEAMSSEHRLQWIEAAIAEIVALEKFGCWIEVPIEEATTKVLPGTWVFRVKRAPDGSFKKFKARYCIRGDLQEGIFETYAPVVQFSSVRLFLAWSLILGWYTCSIDFSNAFIQAALTDDTFIHLPRGFRSSQTAKTCLKLKRSLYGLAVAPRLWYLHLLKALKELGLKPSKHDACLMFRKDLIVICYVDDLGIQAPNKSIVDKLITQLKEKGFDLTLEGSFSEYLGIQYTKLSDTKIKMTQEGLIKKIMEATGMNDCNSNRTPTTKEALGSDEQGEPMEDPWNYRSVIGMLLYLSTNTRPDIAYAVSQVARFSHNPKKSHASAVKTIIRYLAGSKDQGVIYERPKTLRMDCYVDADFAGLYGRDSPESPTSAKSRTGYIISVGGCYILCKSQLQSTIALSTSEAEYGALSQAMRAVIPIRETLLEMINAVEMIDVNNKRPFGNKEDLLSFQTVIHEDNSAALSLAVNQKVTSRTKHWCVKFHFFWSYVNDTKNNTKCVKVDTKEQRADYLTKGLTRDTFEHCRHLNQGW